MTTPLAPTLPPAVTTVDALYYSRLIEAWAERQVHTLPAGTDAADEALEALSAARTMSTHLSLMLARGVR